MKKIILLLIIILSVCKSRAQDTLSPTDPKIIQIQSLDLSQFTGKPVDSLLAQLPTGYTSITIGPSIRLKRAAFLIVEYAPGTAVYLAVRTFNFMNPEFSPTGNPTQNWDISLFKKETLSFAVAFNRDCINGCDNQSKLN